MTARVKLLGVRFTAGEFVEIAAAADTLGMTPTAWVRHQALRALSGKSEWPTWIPPSPTTEPSARLIRTAGTRFTETQMVALEAHSRACGLTPTGFIRKLVLGVKLIARIPAIRSAIVAVNRVGTNLNQLVKVANSGVVLAPDLIRVIHEVLAEIYALQKMFVDRDR